MDTGSVGENVLGEGKPECEVFSSCRCFLVQENLAAATTLRLETQETAVLGFSCRENQSSLV